jgi:hypothetical protein
MKKSTGFLIILLAMLLIPVVVQAQALQGQHPDCFSGELSNYEGVWILEGHDLKDTPWMLEISDGKFTLYNKDDEVVYKGDVEFKPGYGPDSGVDTLVLPLAEKMELVLINVAGGLIDVSNQKINFVLPGNKIEFDEMADFESYSKEDMVGDWELDKIVVLILKYSYVQELSNDDIVEMFAFEDRRIILSFDNGTLYYVSEKSQARIPITHYRIRGPYYLFENPKPVTPYLYKYIAYIAGKDAILSEPGQMVISAYPEGPPLDDGAEVIVFMVFSRITSADLSEGETQP